MEEEGVRDQAVRVKAGGAYAGEHMVKREREREKGGREKGEGRREKGENGNASEESDKHCAGCLLSICSEEPRGAGDIVIWTSESVSQSVIFIFVSFESAAEK